MTNRPTLPSLAHLPLIAAFSLLGLSSHAIELTWSSPPRIFTGPGTDIETVNRQSNGALVDNTFYFTMGNFIGDFVPTASNLDQWAANFVPFGSARYSRKDELAGTGLDPAIVSQFARTRNLDSNAAPFGVGDSIYIWGYNVNSNTLQSNEWILFTQSEWTWPAAGASTGGDVGVYSVTDSVTLYPPGEEIEVTLGQIRTWVDEDNDTYHDFPERPVFTTARVLNNPPIPRLSFDQWSGAVFTQAGNNQTQEDSRAIGDPDGDNLTNFEEFAFGTDPLFANPIFELPGFQIEKVEEGGELFIETSIARSPLTTAPWTIEESTNLQLGSWSDFQLTATDLSTSTLFRLRTVSSVDDDSSNRRFFRLRTDIPQP